MLSKNNKFISQNLLVIFFLLMIAPFVILFYYINPSNDDWTLTYYSNIKNFFDSQLFYYKFWSGRYFSNALFYFHPLHYNSFIAYKLLSFFLFILFIYVLFSLISELTNSAITLKEKLILTLSILYLYLYAMTSVSQSFYWYITAIVYQLGIIMIMIFLLLYAKITNPERISKVSHLTFLSVLMLIAIVGCSEISMLTGVMIISLLVMCKLITDKKLNLRLTFFTIITFFCVYILFSAPGNAERGKLYPASHQLLLSLKISISSMFGYLISWVFYSPLLFITLLMLPVLFKIVLNSTKKHINIFINPFYVSTAFIGILFLLFFAPAWSIGDVPFGRTANMIYFVFLIGWFYNIIVLILFLTKKYNFNIDRIPQYFYTLALIIVILFLFKKNNVKNAYSDLLKGRAAAYNEELIQRYDMIENSSADTLAVPELANKPNTIFADDITTDPKFTYNKMFARYFKKKGIYIVPADSSANK